MSTAEVECPRGGECALHAHDLEAGELVTKEFCREKHKWNIWAFGVVFALMSLFLALSGLALANSSTAISNSGDVKIEMTEKLASSDKALEVHLARQEESNKALLATLNAMQESIKTNTETLRKQNEQIAAQSAILEKLSEKLR